MCSAQALDRSRIVVEGLKRSAGVDIYHEILEDLGSRIFSLEAVFSDRISKTSLLPGKSRVSELVRSFHGISIPLVDYIACFLSI